MLHLSYGSGPFGDWIRRPGLLRAWVRGGADRGADAACGDVRRVERIQAAIEKAVDRIDREPHLLVEEPSPFTRATKLADAYGLVVCGRG